MILFLKKYNDLWGMKEVHSANAWRLGDKRDGSDQAKIDQRLADMYAIYEQFGSD